MADGTRTRTRTRQRAAYPFLPKERGERGKTEQTEHRSGRGDNNGRRKGPCSSSSSGQTGVQMYNGTRRAARRVSNKSNTARRGDHNSTSRWSLLHQAQHTWSLERALRAAPFVPGTTSAAHRRVDAVGVVLGEATRVAEALRKQAEATTVWTTPRSVGAATSASVDAGATCTGLRTIRRSR